MALFTVKEVSNNLGYTPQNIYLKIPKMLEKGQAENSENRLYDKWKWLQFFTRTEDKTNAKNKQDFNKTRRKRTGKLTEKINKSLITL